MNRTSPAQIRTLLSELGLRPNKTLGQNFLIDRNILDILLASADLNAGDGVLEIGPGLGAVTERLLDCCGRVVAVEKDRLLANYLREQFREAPNLELIHGDALRIDAPSLVKSGLRKVVSNLPYGSGTRIVLELACAEPSPDLFVVTVQREVAERMVATKGRRQRGLLSVWLQLDYDVEIVRHVKSTCFWPRPDVESSIVRAARRSHKRLSPTHRQLFNALVKHSFSRRRKQIRTILQSWKEYPLPDALDMLEAAGIDERARPADLSVDDWLQLTMSFADM